MSLNLEVLIKHLEMIDTNLSILWGECRNYDILEGLEAERVHLRKLIDSIQDFTKQFGSKVRGQGGSPKPQTISGGS
jgi:hypothetical protein